MFLMLWSLSAFLSVSLGISHVLSITRYIAYILINAFPLSVTIGTSHVLSIDHIWTNQYSRSYME